MHAPRLRSSFPEEILLSSRSYTHETHRGHEGIQAEIRFVPVDEQRLRDVLLYNAVRQAKQLLVRPDKRNAATLRRVLWLVDVRWHVLFLCALALVRQDDAPIRRQHPRLRKERKFGWEIALWEEGNSGFHQKCSPLQ